MTILAKDRVRPGFYRHHAGGDPYVVVAVSVMDEHGHGNADAPRIVTYHSTRSFETELANSHTEEDFVRPTLGKDGVTRPRFERIEYTAPDAKPPLSPTEARVAALRESLRLTHSLIKQADFDDKKSKASRLHDDRRDLEAKLRELGVEP